MKIAGVAVLAPGVMLVAAATWKIVQISTPQASYVVGLAAGLCLCAAGLQRGFSMIMPAILIWSAAASFYAADFYLYATKVPAALIRQNQLIQQWQADGVDYDPRTPLQVVRDMRADGIEAFPKINPRTLLRLSEDRSFHSIIKLNGREVIPISSFSNALSVNCNESGEFSIFQTDKFGFHNPSDVYDERPKIVMVGDSFTEGSCVPSAANFGARLREHVPNTVNLGMGGNGPLMTLAGLVEMQEHIGSATVVWIYYEGNDLEEQIVEFSSPLLRRYLEPKFSQAILEKKVSIDTVMSKYVDERLADDRQVATDSTDGGKASISDFLYLRHLRDALMPPARRLTITADDIERFRLVFETAMKRAGHSDFLFVYLPDRGRFLGEPNQSFSFRDDILSTVGLLGVPTLDLSRELEQLADPVSLYAARGRGHFTREGYAFTGDAIVRFLRENGAI